MLRCLNGRKVACILSKEITVMPVTEVRESQMSIITITRKGCLSCAARNCLERNLFSQPLRRKWNTIRTVAIPPTNISATKRIIDRRFTATIGNSYGKVHSKPCAALGWRDRHGACCFLSILFSLPFRKKWNKVWLVENWELGVN